MSECFYLIVSPKMSFERQIKCYMLRREAPVAFELYRLLKNRISKGLNYQKSQYEFTDVMPEYPINERPRERYRADLIVFVRLDIGGEIWPFLIIEVKSRDRKKLGKGSAETMKQVSNYWRKLTKLTSFLAIYNGWSLWVFESLHPNLIGIYGDIANEDQVENLLVGLEEYRHKGVTDLLTALPKPKSKQLIIDDMMPSIVREFAKEFNLDEKDLFKSWKSTFLYQLAKMKKTIK